MDWNAWKARSRRVLLPLLLLAVIGGLALARDSAADPRAAPRRLPPGIVYLAPADQFTRTLYLAVPETGQTIPLLTENNLEDYAVSPDGQAVAYTHHDDDATTDIWLLDLRGGAPRPLTNCVAARCHSPAWKPDGTRLAYTRTDVNPGAEAWDTSSRIWLVDLATLETHLLDEEGQILGESPVWSPDGQRLAYSDPSIPGIRIHRFDGQPDTVFRNLQGVVGHWSPDGTQLVYPVLVRGLLGEEFYTHLEIADLATGTLIRLSGPEDAPLDDGEGVWSPDGQEILIARRYLDNRYTPGKQIVVLDLDSGAVAPLIVDAAYNHGVLGWDDRGQRVIFQRFPLAAPDAQPEVWLFDRASGTLRQIAADAFLPRWKP